MFSLNKGAYSLELLAEKKEVVLAIPGVDLTSALIGCGTCSLQAAHSCGCCPERWTQTTMLSISAMSEMFTAMKMWMLYLAGKVTLNLRLHSKDKKGRGGCLRIAASGGEVII